jgi:predicted RNA methylase
MAAAGVAEVLAGTRTHALVCGDCRDHLGSFRPEWRVITDPPYGIRYRNRRSDIRPHVDFAEPITGDDGEVGQEVITACFRLGLPVCAFAHHRRPWEGDWRQWLVWDKGPAVGGGGDPATCWKFTWELIQVGGFGRLNGQRDSAVLSYWTTQAAMPDHPTQKPLPLMRYLIEKLTDPGDVIVDPFCGSGTTVMAALLTGRRAIGFEADPEYHAVAQRRVAAVVTCPLFDPPPAQANLFDREDAPCE